MESDVGATRTFAFCLLPFYCGFAALRYRLLVVAGVPTRVLS
jgi:hypothetical protein